MKADGSGMLTRVPSIFHPGAPVEVKKRTPRRATHPERLVAEVHFRMTDAQRAKYLRNGGCHWLRRLIDEAQED